MMMKHAGTLLAILSLAGVVLAACGEQPAAGPPPPWESAAGATGAAALADGTVLLLEVERTRESWEEDVHAESDPPHDVSAPWTETLWLTPSGAIAVERTADGVRMLSVADGGGAWQRAGCVVTDAPPDVTDGLRTRALVLLTLLAAESEAPAVTHTLPARGAPGTYVVTGAGSSTLRVTLAEDGVPSRIDRMAQGADPAGIGVRSEIHVESDALRIRGLRVPRTWSVTTTFGLRTEIVRTRVVNGRFGDPDDDALPARPVLPAATLADPRRMTLPARDAAVISHTGPLTDLPALHARLAEAVRVTRAARRSPDVLEIVRFPDARGVAEIRLWCAVSWSQDPGTGQLVSPFRARRIPAAEVLAFDCSGRYPGDPTVVERAAQAARAEGLAQAGAPRFEIRSDTMSGAPDAVDAVLLLPVAPAED